MNRNSSRLRLIFGITIVTFDFAACSLNCFGRGGGPESAVPLSSLLSTIMAAAAGGDIRRSM
jgi:hypothetical protein